MKLLALLTPAAMLAVLWALEPVGGLAEPPARPYPSPAQGRALLRGRVVSLCDRTAAHRSPLIPFDFDRELSPLVWVHWFKGHLAV